MEEWGDQELHPETGAGLLDDFLAETHCPEAFESVFVNLPPPASPWDEHKVWLNDTVLALYFTYIQCKFETLKRVLFPSNVSMNTNNKYVFTETGKGTHWVDTYVLKQTVLTCMIGYA